jgi:flagellar hook-basal body complex protein FliE
MNILSSVLSATIKPISVPELPSPNSTASGAGGFADAFATAINQVESDQQVANSAATDLLAGGKGDIHNVALASQRAELSMELFQQVRNKFVQAYQEVMKMPM